MAKVFQVDSGGTLTTSLVSYYKLEDATDFFGSNDLSNTGSVTFAAGKVNNSAQLSGSNYLSKASASGVPTGSASFSLSAWVKTSGTASQWYFSIGDDTAGAGHCGSLNATGGNLKFVGSGGTFVVDSGISINNGAYHHCVVTYDGTTLRTYVDNVAGATGTFTLALSGANVVVGAAPGSKAEVASGGCDEASLHTKKLSTTEISDLWNGGSGQTMVNSVAATAGAVLMASLALS